MLEFSNVAFRRLSDKPATQGLAGSASKCLLGSMHSFSTTDALATILLNR